MIRFFIRIVFTIPVIIKFFTIIMRSISIKNSIWCIHILLRILNQVGANTDCRSTTLPPNILTWYKTICEHKKMAIYFNRIYRIVSRVAIWSKRIINFRILIFYLPSSNLCIIKTCAVIILVKSQVFLEFFAVVSILVMQWVCFLR
ncbi:hypothetical protein SAMN05192529_11616 [Arachidicoccus rhizosphaerae]|uniref:Uncharacterized protein n=1 Tax=Arachidicoccus rhizosphaerae TaxID=551991 RepID=A0A1H4AQU0_9BACT|nr:hypothetical protein SAMN05192529_11616 [Arachidicoccus rhizosphaerae]